MYFLWHRITDKMWSLEPRHYKSLAAAEQAAKDLRYRRIEFAITSSFHKPKS
jgi:hypothetical protein